MHLMGDERLWTAVSRAPVHTLPTEMPAAPLVVWANARALELALELDDLVVIEAAAALTQSDGAVPAWRPWPLSSALGAGRHAIAAAVAVAFPDGRSQVFVETRVASPHALGARVAHAQATEAARSLAWQHLLPQA
jgi:hypothetical protein